MYINYLYDRLAEAEYELSKTRDTNAIEALTEEIAQLQLLLDEFI